jgi:SAM-dependent methyltransferase
MHSESLQMMAQALERAQGVGLRVLDVGAFDVNGTYRPIVEGRGWTYTGLDVREGPNVDIVTEHLYKYPFKAGEFDIVISGNAAHNVERPWKWVPELVRVLKPGGLLVVVTIWRWGVNGYPVDYWRFLPDGLRVLFDDTHKLGEYVLDMDTEGNTVGSAVRQ